MFHINSEFTGTICLLFWRTSQKRTTIPLSNLVETYVTSRLRIAIRKISGELGEEETYIGDYELFKTTNSIKPLHVLNHTTELIDNSNNSIRILSTNSDNISYSFEIVIPYNEYYNQISVKNNKVCVNVDDDYRTDVGCIVTRIDGPENADYQLGYIQSENGNETFISVMRLGDIAYETLTSIFVLPVGIYNAVILKKHHKQQNILPNFS